MLAAGQKLERYVVEDYAGHGAMAVVYRARHLELGTLHALKVLANPRPGVRDRLLQEGRAQAALRHPNLVGVTDVLRVDGALALVMEHVDGPDLGRWLARFGPATADEARTLVRHIASGLGEAHARGVTHRDLKPANVLLERTSSGLRAKVTDFGIAKVFEEGGTSSTRSNVAMGTPHYMAPEQIRDAAAVDARADLFALGAVLYEIVTGQPAFPGDDVLTVMNAVVAGGFRPPRELVPDLPDDLDAVIAGCLVVEPSGRLQRCADVLARLDDTAPIPITRGADLDAAAWEDDEMRAARAEWLNTSPPASDRVVDDAPETVEPAPSRAPTEPAAPPVARDERVSRARPASSAVTAPRPPERPSRPAAGPSTARLVVRRVVLSALLGTILGLVGFAFIVWLLGGPPGRVTYEAPPPTTGLEQVVDPASPPP